jgi:peroxiredoxin
VSVRAARIVGGGLISALAALFTLNLIFVGRSCDALRPMQAGDVAATFTLPRADGEGSIGLSELTAKHEVVLIDFWATWCGPCEQTMPMLARLWRKHHDEGFEILSVNTDGGPRAAKLAQRYRLAHGLPFPVVVDDGTASDQYRVSEIPHMVLVDKRGRVALVHTGVLRVGALEDELDAKIRSLLKEE